MAAPGRDQRPAATRRDSVPPKLGYDTRVPPRGIAQRQHPVKSSRVANTMETFAERQEDDPELPIEIVRDVIREGFPQFAVRSIEHLGSGWSFDAYLVDDAMVFKFPRHAAAARDLDRIDRIQTV